MTTPVFLSIRNKSTRLPGKSFASIGGIPAAEWLIARLKSIGGGVDVVICTSVHPDDALFEEVARRRGVDCYRGSPDDKLRRYRDAMAAGPIEGDRRDFWEDFFVVVDGDDVLCDPRQLCRIVLAMRDRPEIDYCMVRDLPVGATGFGVRLRALEDVIYRKRESDTEVWGSYFTESHRYQVELLAPDRPELRRPDLRITLDYPEDLEVINAVVSSTGTSPLVPLEDIVAVFESEPGLADVNRAAGKRYLANLDGRRTPVPTGDAVEGLRRHLTTARDRTDVDAALDAARRQLH